jgi:hypothetical protein
MLLLVYVHVCNQCLLSRSYNTAGTRLSQYVRLTHGKANKILRHRFSSFMIGSGKTTD